MCSSPAAAVTSNVFCVTFSRVWFPKHVLMPSRLHLGLYVGYESELNHMDVMNGVIGLSKQADNLIERVQTGLIRDCAVSA